MKLSAAAFELEAREMLLVGPRRNGKCSSEDTRKFRAHLGCSFETISVLWNRIDPKCTMSRRCAPKHMLWMMVHLKVNMSESVHLTITRCKCRETFAFWVDRFLEATEDLFEEIIDFNNRFRNWDGRTRCLICIDGTDTKMLEPGARSSVWWSFKFNGPGLRHKAATCIKTGDIVWFRGPFPCNFSDRDIFDMFLSSRLIAGEGVKADSGHSGRKQIFAPGCAQNSVHRKEKSQVRGRHENVNGLFKVFGVMKKWHNNDAGKHGRAARVVAVTVQTSFSIGSKLCEVPCNANCD